MKSKLPITRPFFPMEAKSVEEIPTGSNWQYEPKWDGFRCVAFREGRSVELQSKSAQSLTRYFPELVAALGKLKPDKFVLDGELIVLVDEKLSFDDLLQRIHPAESRVAKLSIQTPAKFVLFVESRRLGKSTYGAIKSSPPLSVRRWPVNVAGPLPLFTMPWAPLTTSATVPPTAFPGRLLKV